MECGFKNKETQGLFSKIYPEGVSSNLDTWSKILRLRRLPGPNTGAPVVASRSWAPDGGAIADLAGALGFLATEHQNAKEKRLGVEKLTGVSLGVVCSAEEQGAGLAACGSSLPTSVRSEAKADGG